MVTPGSDIMQHSLKQRCSGVPALTTNLTPSLPRASCRHQRSSKATCRATAQSDQLDWHQNDLKHVLAAQQFSPASMQIIFDEAKRMETLTPGSDLLRGYIMSTLFYEPSTRTRLSFESAMNRLGGSVISTESAGEYSSAAKGETLEGERPCHQTS